MVFEFGKGKEEKEAIITIYFKSFTKFVFDSNVDDHKTTTKMNKML